MHEGQGKSRIKSKVQTAKQQRDWRKSKISKIQALAKVHGKVVDSAGVRQTAKITSLNQFAAKRLSPVLRNVLRSNCPAFLIEK